MDIQNLFKNKSLLRQALTLAHHGKTASYERLEFLGDRVLGLVVATMLYEQHPDENEGILARRFTELVREETLAEVAHNLSLPDLLITHENELRQNQSILADVCEALLGALYLDQGLETVQNFILPIWLPLMRQNKKAPKDAKSTLQELAQKKGQVLPKYTVLKKTGPDHAPIFEIEVCIPHIGSAIGISDSKKTAEQQAAKSLLEKLHALS